MTNRARGFRSPPVIQTSLLAICFMLILLVFTPDPAIDILLLGAVWVLALIVVYNVWHITVKRE